MTIRGNAVASRISGLKMIALAPVRESCDKYFELLTKLIWPVVAYCNEASLNTWMSGLPISSPPRWVTISPSVYPLLFTGQLTRHALFLAECLQYLIGNVDLLTGKRYTAINDEIVSLTLSNCGDSLVNTILQSSQFLILTQVDIFT